MKYDGIFGLVTRIQLTTIIRTHWDGKSALKLYVYDAEGGTKHRGGQWFEDVPSYPECITTDEALQRIAAAVERKQEVQICDGGDELVFHIDANGTVLHDGWLGKGQR